LTFPKAFKEPRLIERAGGIESARRRGTTLRTSGTMTVWQREKGRTVVLASQISRLVEERPIKKRDNDFR